MVLIILQQQVGEQQKSGLTGLLRLASSFA